MQQPPHCFSCFPVADLPSLPHGLFSTQQLVWSFKGPLSLSYTIPFPSCHSHLLTSWSSLQIYGQLWFLCAWLPYIPSSSWETPLAMWVLSKDPGPLSPWGPPVQGLSPSLPISVIHTQAHIPINQNSPSSKTLHFHISLSSQLSLFHAHPPNSCFAIWWGSSHWCPEPRAPASFSFIYLSNESYVRFTLSFLSSPSYLNLCSNPCPKISCLPSELF